MFKEIIIFGTLLAICMGEAPLSGPYPPSGWRPQGAPFTLPKDFLPQQQQNRAQAPNAEVEVTQERVDYAGQLGESATTAEPSNAYLPPQPEEIPEEAVTEDFLKVQGLPQNTNHVGDFNPPRNGQLNTFEYAPPQVRRGQYRIQNNRQFGQIRAQPRPQPVFGRLVAPVQRQIAVPVSQAPVHTLSREYGPPQPDNGNAERVPGGENENGEDSDERDDSGENEEPTIAVANAVSNGQYYILTPDNTLQRVVFMTTQNEDEARINGFTAQLRYMPVEPIRDPVYAYNEQGQLIRIYNKK